jgi:hypothetical protein
MSNFIIHDGELYHTDELYHHGVKGMKWGKRKAKIVKRLKKSASRTPAATAVRAVSRNSPAVTIPKNKDKAIAVTKTVGKKLAKKSRNSLKTYAKIGAHVMPAAILARKVKKIVSKKLAGRKSVEKTLSANGSDKV